MSGIFKAAKDLCSCALCGGGQLAGFFGPNNGPQSDRGGGARRRAGRHRKRRWNLISTPTIPLGSRTPSSETLSLTAHSN